jgi:hypothetical protein
MPTEIFMRVTFAFICFMATAGMAVALNQSEKPNAPNDALGRPLQPDAKGKADTTRLPLLQAAVLLRPARKVKLHPVTWLRPTALQSR